MAARGVRGARLARGRRRRAAGGREPGGLVVGIAVPFAADRMGSRRSQMALAAGTAAAGFVGVSLAPDVAWLWALLLGVGLGAIFPLCLTLPVDVADDFQFRVGAIAALMLLGGYLISGFGPVLLGLVRDATGDFSASIWLLVALGIVLVAACLTLSPDRLRRASAPVGRTRWRPKPAAPADLAGSVGCARARYHRSVAADETPTLTNGDLARIFHDIGDMLEVKGELVFKTVAYHRAADAIAHSPIDLVAAYRAASAEDRGVGQAISDKIAELVRPAGCGSTKAPGGGPALSSRCSGSPVSARRPSQLHEELGIETLEDLRRRPRAARCARSRAVRQDRAARSSRGSPRLERPPQRMLLDQAERSSTASSRRSRECPGSIWIEPAGSFRRRRETIGDLDLLAETTSRRPDRPLRRPRRRRPGRQSGRLQGGGRLLRGPQVDLMIMPPGEAGTYLIHFTGAKDHNVRLRGWPRSRLEPVRERAIRRRRCCRRLSRCCPRSARLSGVTVPMPRSPTSTRSICETFARWWVLMTLLVTRSRVPSPLSSVRR